MTDKYLEPTQAESHEISQRYHLGKVGMIAPVYLVLGNHDGEVPASSGLWFPRANPWSSMCVPTQPERWLINTSCRPG